MYQKSNIFKGEITKCRSFTFLMEVHLLDNSYLKYLIKWSVKLRGWIQTQSSLVHLVRSQRSTEASKVVWTIMEKNSQRWQLSVIGYLTSLYLITESLYHFRGQRSSAAPKHTMLTNVRPTQLHSKFRGEEGLWFWWRFLAHEHLSGVHQML